MDDTVTLLGVLAPPPAFTTPPEAVTVLARCSKELGIW
jgi:hypothetical protein